MMMKMSKANKIIKLMMNGFKLMLKKKRKIKIRKMIMIINMKTKFQLKRSIKCFKDFYLK